MLLAINASDVSIHAPVKSATDVKKAINSQWQVSIHAPVKSATCVVIDFAYNLDVSIHAPVKSATDKDLH